MYVQDESLKVCATSVTAGLSTPRPPVGMPLVGLFIGKRENAMLTIAGGIILAIVILVAGLFVLGFVLEYWKQVLAVAAVIVGLIVIAVTDSRPSSTQTNNGGWGPLMVANKTKLNSGDIPIECTSDLRGKAKSDFYILPRGTPPLPNEYELAGSETVSPALSPGNICWYHPEQFRKLYPEYNDLTDGDLRSRLYAKAKIEYAASHQ